MNSESNGDLTQLRPLSRAPGTGPTLDVLGVPHIYKAMADDTGHQFSVWESIVPPGAGTPPHTHSREDEAFYMLGGEVLFEVEGATDPLRLGAGGFLFAPRNRRHAYRNIGTVAAHLLVFAIPGAIACSRPSPPPANAPDTRRLSKQLPPLPNGMASWFIRRPGNERRATAPLRRGTGQECCALPLTGARTARLPEYEHRIPAVGAFNDPAQRWIAPR